MEVRKLNELLNYLNNYAKNRKNKQRVSAIMVCLAVIVSFTVSVGLIEPAESASGELICGMEEHEHTQDCFELICGFDEETEEEIVVETTLRDSEETMESTISTEETTTADTEPATTETATTDTETTETIISTCTDESVPVPVHIHSDECYRLICLTEAHLHKQDCYNQPVETEPAATEISTSTSTGKDTTATTEQTTETTTTTIELPEKIYELNADTFGELYKDRVSVLADAKTIIKDRVSYTYYEIEDVKFYYDNTNLYYNKDCFAFLTDLDNHPACNVTSNVSVEYNGTIRKGVYNFDYPRLGDVRYISFTAPEDGTLIYVFSKIEENDATTYKIRVTRQEGEADNVNDDVVIVNDKAFSKDTSNELKITVKKGETYEIRQTAGEKTARIGYIDFIPNIKIEEYKFYYDNNKILNHHDCFSYPDGITGPNADTITDKRDKVYNGIEYDYAYNFNGVNNTRYIELAAPANGTWILVFDDITEGNFDITVNSTYGNVKKSFTSSSDGVMTMSVQKDTVYTAKQTAIDGNQKGKARLVYAEFVPVPEAGKIYRIIDVETGKYVELSGTNIELGGETPSGDLSNDFELTDAGDGSFNIYPQSIENKVIDYDVNNKNIHIYNSNGNNNQKFQFILNDDGTYKIKSPGYNDSYWKVDENNDIKTDSSAEASNFRIVEATEIVYSKADIDTTKTYLIKNVRSRQYIHMEAEVYRDSDGNIIYKKNYTDEEWDAINNKTYSTEQIIQIKDVGADSQFKFISTGTAGEYYIVSADGKYALTTGQNITNGTDVKYSEFNYADNQKFYAEQMENGSVRFYQIDNNGKKFYLEINGQSTNTGADVDLWDANKVNDHQCFFLVPVVAPEEVPEANTRVEARVIFADYNDGKIDDNTRNLYDEPAWIPTFSLYMNGNWKENQDGNLVVDVSSARKDWCYQYNYVWDLGESNTTDKYYVALNGVNNKQITLNGKTFRVHYLKDTELGHPGQCNKNDPYSQIPSDYNQTGDQIIYIFLDPVVEEWWPNGNQPGTFDLSMKKRWDGHNASGYDNRPKEKIKIQLQRLNSSGQWVEYKPEDFGETYTFKCYFEVVDVNGKNKRYVDLREFLNYKKNLNIPDATNVTNIKRTLTNNGAEYTIVYNNETYTFSEDDFNYEDLKNHNCLFEKESGTLKRANLELGYNEWNNVVLTVDGNNNPTHFTNGYYFNWKAIPYGQYRVIETQSFYDANDNNVFDEGDRDTSQEYYYMSYPPMRDSRGVLHIQNFTKDMVIEVQKKWQDDKGGDLTLNKPIEFEIWRYENDPQNSVPDESKMTQITPSNGTVFTTNKNGYAFITSRAYDVGFDGNKTGDGYYYGVTDMETKNGDTKYHYFIKEIVPDGYKLINGNEKGYVLKNGSTTDYSVDYEDGDSRKFIITNKAKIGLRVEKEWYNSSVSDENKIDYYNNNTDNPIYPKFKIYKGDRPGTPVVNDDICSVNDVALEEIAEVTIGKDGYFELVSDANDVHGDSSNVNNKLNMLSDTKYELVSTGFDGNIFRNASDYPANIQGDYIVVDGTNRFWVGSNKTKNNQVKAPYITGTLTLEFENYDENSILSVGNRCNINGAEYNEAKYYNIKDANGVVSIPGLYVDGNYRIMGYNCTLNIKKVTFTHDAYYYIQEIKDDNYTLSNGDSNGFVKIGDNFYTTITANNHYPVVTAQNIPKVNLDITKEWTQSNANISKAMNFEIYKAFANGEPVADDKG